MQDDVMYGLRDVADSAEVGQVLRRGGEVQECGSVGAWECGSAEGSQGSSTM